MKNGHNKPKSINAKPGKWDKVEDAKLKLLFDNGSLDPKDLNSKTIHNIIDNHWPTRPYNSFAQLYKNKARQYCVNKTKAGSRSLCEFSCTCMIYFILY